ncbi:MAG: hypothetical protein HYU77_15030 [Betaproteobacteria bacterium]|nr:hypothetical protein [Betaproteobacteria bacterium]
MFGSCRAARRGGPGISPQLWPEQYLTGKAQLERNLQRTSMEQSRA